MLNTNLNSDIKKILTAAVGFFGLALFFLYVPAAIYVDLVILAHGMPESSVTEYSQEALLLGSTVAFLYLAYKSEQQRSFALLVGGFFGALFIRELDGVFDQIQHGAWVYFVIAWAAMIFILVSQHKGQTIRVMAQASQSRSFVYVVVGLAVLLVFSRVFGTTRLWQAIFVESAQVGLLKNTIQEGLELLGYQIIFIGALKYVLVSLREKAPKANSTGVKQAHSLSL